MNSKKGGGGFYYIISNFSLVEIIWCLQVIFFTFHCSNLHICSNYCTFSLAEINLMGVSLYIWQKGGSFKLILCSRTWNPIISTFSLKLWFHVSILQHVFLYHPSMFFLLMVDRISTGRCVSKILLGNWLFRSASTKRLL